MVSPLVFFFFLKKKTLFLPLAIGYLPSVLHFLMGLLQIFSRHPKSLKVNYWSFLYNIYYLNSSILHPFPFLFFPVSLLTRGNILISVMWNLFSHRFFYCPTLNSILHHRTYSCMEYFSLKLEGYLLVIHNTRDALFHPACFNPVD